jgi:undecaprenyl diphosphate synthase
LTSSIKTTGLSSAQRDCCVAMMKLACAELHIPAVTLWVFSTENLKRSQAEVSGILSAIEAKVAALTHDPFMHQKRIRIQAIGCLDLLPESVVAANRAAETATAQ